MLQSRGISDLLAAEKKAQELIEEARKRRSIDCRSDRSRCSLFSRRQKQTHQGRPERSESGNRAVQSGTRTTLQGLRTTGERIAQIDSLFVRLRFFRSID